MLNPALVKLHKTSILIALTSVAFYISFAYDLVRTDSTKLISLYVGLFFLFYKLVQINKDNFKFLIAIAFIFRIIFLVATPNLSQDFYRFIWDGRMILEGFNPYLFTPESFIKLGKYPIVQAQELYNGMGVLNGSHFTNYPPIKQFIFVIAAMLSGKSLLGSVIIFRIFIIVADFGTLYFGTKLLKKFNLPVHNIFWYLLNPFIIIELTGNSHFESIMIFFFVWSLYLLHSGKWKLAGVVFTLSVSVKLIPLIFLPLFFQWFKKQEGGIFKLVGFYLIIAISTLLLFSPFYSSEFVTNYSETVALWFGQFEFNASLYYVSRAIGYAITGYNEIAIIGKFLPVLTLIFVLGITFLRKNKTTPELIAAMLFASTFYYFMSTTIHPWYIATLLILSVFTNYKFPLVWSLMIVLSYFAYSHKDYSENLWIVGLEYVVVYTMLLWEVFYKNQSNINSQKPHLHS